MNLFDLDASISLNSEDFVQGIRRAIESGGKIVESMSKASESVRQYQDKLKNIAAEYSAQTAKANELAEKQQALIEKVNQSRESVEKASEKLDASKEKYKSLSESLAQSQERYDKLSEALDKAVEEFGEESEEAQKARESLEQAGDTVYKYQERVDKAADAVEKYKKQLGKAQSQLSQNQGELKSTNSAIDRNIEALDQNRNAAQRAIEESKKIGLLPKAFAGAAEGIKKISFGFNSAKEKASDFINKIPGVSKAMEFKNTGLSRLKSDFDALKVVSQAFKDKLTPITNVIKNIASSAAKISFKAAKAGVEAFGNAAKKSVEITKQIISTVAKVGSAAVGAASAAVVAFGKKSVDAGMNFDKSMSQVAATMGKSVEEVSELREFAQEMGRTTAFSAKDSADALNYMALAGYDAETSMKMLPNVLNLAAAGNMDLALASDMITDSQSALGLSLDETTQLVDKMAKASSKSNTSVSQLGDAILTVGGTAKKLKGGTTELATVLGILADNGIKGSEGGTALRNIINSLISPTDDARAMLDAMGASLYDSEGNMRSLNDVFIDLRNGMSGLATDAEKDQVLTTIFNSRDLKSAEALIANVGDRFNELSSEIDNSANAADAMAKTQLDNLAGDVTLFKSALEGAQIAVSDSLTPALRDFVKIGSNAMSDVALAFSNSDSIEDAVFKTGRYMQKYIYEFVSKITDAIPTIITVASTLVGSLGQAIVKNVPKLANSAVGLLKGFAESVTKNAPTAIKGFSDVLKSISEWLKTNGKSLVASGMKMIQSIAKGISDNLSGMSDSVTGIITFISQMISDNLSLLLESALNILSAVGQGIIDNLPILLNSALEIIKSLANYLSDSLPEMIPAIIDVVLKIVETLTDPQTLSDLVNAALAIITSLADGIVNSLPELVDRMPKIVQGVVDGIVDNVPKLLDAAINILKSLGGYLIDPKNMNDILKAGNDIIHSLVDGITRMFFKLANTAKNIISEIYNNLSFDDVKQWGKDMIDSFINGIRERAERLWEEVKNIAQGVRDFLGFSEPEKGPLSNFHTFAPDMIDLFTKGIKDNKKSIFSEIDSVTEGIKDSFSEPITVSTGVNAKGTLNGFEVPDILSDASIPFVADGGYMTKYSTTNNAPVSSPAESPIVVENMNINLEGMNFSSEYEMNRFINFIAERLKAKNMNDMRGIGGVMF